MNLTIPRLVTFKVQLNSLVTLLLVFVGCTILGLPSMFLSKPISAIVKVLFDNVDEFKPWGFLLGNAITESKKWPC